MAALSEPPDKGSNIREEQEHVKNVQSLPKSEQQVYHQLGPLYQKIYLYAFTNEERHRVLVYISRGLTPYESINTILRTEDRKYSKPAPKGKSISPSDRSTKGASRAQEVF
jgi:hypothetical protein